MAINRRQQIRLSPEEQAAFFRERKKAALATIDKDGFPHVVAMNYVARDGAFYMTSYGEGAEGRGHPAQSQGGRDDRGRRRLRRSAGRDDPGALRDPRGRRQRHGGIRGAGGGQANASPVQPERWPARRSNRAR